jgi:hypothetical protein
MDDDHGTVEKLGYVCVQEGNVSDMVAAEGTTQVGRSKRIAIAGSIIPICGTGITEYVHSKRNIIAFRPLQEMYSPFQIHPPVTRRPSA